MPLVGSLRDLSLPELLLTIDQGEKSGVISIRSDAGTAQIHVQMGRIVQASDTLRDERFGEILLKLGKISHENLAAALDAQRQDGASRRLGVILVEMGMIDREDQDEAVLYQTCEALYDLCTWQVGFFQFDTQVTPEETGIAIPVPTMLEEVERRAHAGERTRLASLPSVNESPLRDRRELTPDKLELIRLTRSFHQKTDEFASEGTPELDPDLLVEEETAPESLDGGNLPLVEPDAEEPPLVEPNAEEPPLVEPDPEELPLVEPDADDPPMLELDEIEIRDEEGDSF